MIQQVGFQHDSMFLTVLTQIAKKHRCIITNFDLENRVIQLDGPTENQTACAIELSDKLGEFLI